MPATFFILLHWKKQQRVFLQNLAKFSKQQQPKTIHDLRVAIKKLRAYLKLLAIVFNKMDGKTGFEKTEQLFSVLGKYRDIEMGLLLLQSFEKQNKITYTALRFQLKTALQRTQIWVQHALNQYDDKELAGISQRLEEQVKQADKQKLLDKTGHVLNKEFKKLKHLARHFHSQPHPMRKMLKNIYYWISIYPNDFLINGNQLQKLKKSLDWLGYWQDHAMLHRKIKHFRKDFVPASKQEYLILKQLEKSMEKKMQTKLHKAHENIRGIYFQTLPLPPLKNKDSR